MTERPNFAISNTNLASPRLGSETLSCSDDFFAPMARMLSDEEPVFIVDKYDDHGKWMDGWESRRRRNGGHDWCIVKLGTSGILSGVNIDTRHFTGNYPPQASLEAAFCQNAPDETTNWFEILPVKDLNGDSENFFKIDSQQVVSHLRLNILPDGGVARLRVYGAPVAEWEDGDDTGIFELSGLKNGSAILDYNDAHYGNVWTLLTDGRGRDMGDGWETRRRREPGHDWIIIKLGTAGLLERVEVDTANFKGNFPDRCSLEGALGENGDYVEILAEQKLSADTIHHFDVENQPGPFDRVRLNIFPDGGVSRLRVFGRLAK